MVAIIDFALKLCEIFIIIYIVLGLLAGYGIIGDKSHLTIVRTFFAEVLDPVLRPLRTVLPDLRVTDPAAPVLVIIILIVRYILAFYRLAETNL